jgi:hypothetical protein
VGLSSVPAGPAATQSRIENFEVPITRHPG